MKSELKCDKCDFQAESLTPFLDHISKKHNDKILNCEGCEFTCKTENDLAAHKQLIQREFLCCYHVISVTSRYLGKQI